MKDPTSTFRTCTASNRFDRFCNQPSVPGAPFPICVHHATQLYTFLRGVVDDPANRTAFDVRTSGELALQVRRRTVGDAPFAVVYYVQVGDTVKIGTTAGPVWQRIKVYPPNRILLAAEPGGYELETRRLAQFSHLLVAGREWHRMGDDLRLHMHEVRERHGVPEDRLDWRPAGVVDPTWQNVLGEHNADIHTAGIDLPPIGSPELDALLDAIDAEEQRQS